MNDLEDRYEHHKVKTQNSHFAIPAKLYCTGKDYL
jgi:hypothetical protein